MFEKQREKKKDECKLISETKSQHLKEIINSNLALEEKRKEEYYAAQDQAAERKKKLDEQTEIEAEKKRLEDIEKEKQRKAVKEKFDKLLDDKKQFYLRKMGETDEKVINSQMRKTLDLKSKHNADVLKRFIKRDKVESMMRRQEWQRTMIMDKILNSSAKADNIKDERMNILEARQKLRDEISRDKKGIMEKFTKIKMGRVLNLIHYINKLIFLKARPICNLWRI